ncbi:hypothetical protein BDK51DRAFT_32195 [Blyttiomyces helicus]|uniref:Uncharacterized protein n=1 Tax=Blyttiomyces helicus TaxID=388810 RepID=A0A4P9WJ59_9FUNG|nr:hypothetical protein BDK51DRAFT_32195 [Blyttiomyces helicus]|eukprot:RKO91963.1 hypothetical protein BDK51DRAFT_32195 [Blyttiomyces helicus]
MKSTILVAFCILAAGSYTHAAPAPIIDFFANATTTAAVTNATAPATTSSFTAQLAASFENIDISRIPFSGAAAQAVAEMLCPAGADAGALRDSANLCQLFEEDVIVPALQAATASGDKFKIDSLTCQLNRNKILKNTCVKHADEAQVQNPKAATELPEKIQAIVSNIANVDRLCPSALDTDFVTIPATNATSS